MPYIRSGREDLDAGVITPRTPGELNYCLTRIVIEYIEENGLNYDDGIAAAVSAYECAKLEFYRRVAIPYEDRKIVTNGDVYPERLAPR